MSYPQIVHQQTKHDVKEALALAEKQIDYNRTPTMEKIILLLKRIDEDLNY